VAPTKGDSERDFEELVSAYYRPLYQFAYSLAHNEAEASDLTQQTFYIWAGKGRAMRDPSKAKTWLFTTLHRDFLKTRRHQSRFPHRPLDEVADEVPSLSPAVVERLDSDAVLKALGQLDETFRAPLVLFYLGEHSYKDIAEILALPMGTVQSRIARGKAQLREWLTRNDPSAEDSQKVHRG
jgi:RNA polymerase sigma-70 factor (ECF subfamily)